MSTFFLFIFLGHAMILVNSRGFVIKNRLASEQITALRTAGYDIGNLNQHTQLKIFLYAWLAMERAEGGLCRSCDGADSLCSALSAKMNDLKTKYARKKAAVGVASACDKSNPRLCDYGRVICCTGWSKIMSICTQNEWYNGTEAASVQATVDEIKRITTLQREIKPEN